MKIKTRRSKPASIPKTRWLAYASASAATALAGSQSMEAEIHYSGLVNFQFKGTLNHNFPLENGASLFFFHNDLASGGIAHLSISDSGLLAGPYYSNEALFIYRLGNHVNVSQQRFGHSCFRTSCTYGSCTFTYCFGGFIGRFTDGYFTEPGRGFIGFTFNTGPGRQYGWVRVKTSGAGKNNFIVLDYAWGDPGEPIETGQKQSRVNEQAVTKTGSLGLLATGATGLKAWRRQKAATPQ